MRGIRPVPAGPLEVTVTLVEGETPQARVTPVLAGREATRAVRTVDAASAADDLEGAV